MSCEEYVIELCNKKDAEIESLRKNFDDLAKHCDMLQDAVNFIAKGVRLEQSHEGDYYVSVASAWEKYEKDAFDRYCAYFGLQKPEVVKVDEIDAPTETPVDESASEEVVEDAPAED